MVKVSNVVSHWHKLLEGFQTSSQEFYVALDQAIQRRQIPNASTGRVDWNEGGILSARREYFRVVRGKLVFDICAAPFGTGFFFSWWLAERASSLGLLLAIVGLPFLAIFVLSVSLKIFGAFFGFFAFFILFAVALLAIGKLVRGGALGSDAEDVVLSIPLLGRLYEKLFQPETYYKMDTTTMFQEMVHQAVLEVIDGLTNAKGIRALSELERKPIMRTLGS